MLDRILKWLGFRREKSPVETLHEIEKMEEVKRVKKREKKVKEVKRGKREKKGKKGKKAKTKKEMIVEVLKRRKRPAKIEEIAKKVGATVQTTRRYLYYLQKEGKVEKKDGGWVAK